MEIKGDLILPCNYGLNEIEISSITEILAKSDLLPKPNTSPLIIYVNGKRSQQHLLKYVAK